MTTLLCWFWLLEPDTWPKLTVTFSVIVYDLRRVVTYASSLCHVMSLTQCYAIHINITPLHSFQNPTSPIPFHIPYSSTIHFLVVCEYVMSCCKNPLWLSPTRSKCETQEIHQKKDTSLSIYITAAVTIFCEMYGYKIL